MDQKQHNILSRQLKKVAQITDSLDESKKEVFYNFIKEINTTYNNFEDDRELLERAMEISSQELMSTNQEVRNQNSKLTSLLAEFAATKEELIGEKGQRGLLHAAGMAEIATDVLHNVGNILNSVNVNVENIQKVINESVLDSFKAVNAHVKSQRETNESLITQGENKPNVFDFYFELEKALEFDYSSIRQEISELAKNVDLIKNVVKSQQEHANGIEFKEEFQLEDALEDALNSQKAALLNYDITVVKNFAKTKPILASKNKIVHIFINLIKNARESMILCPNQNNVLTLEIFHINDDQISFKITDTGVGIAPEDLNKLFIFGFTTKEQGSGFGLHYCANAIREMGGEIHVYSEGKNKGATFELTFNSLNENS